MNAGKAIAAALALAAAGLVVGLLVAPDKGYKTRKKLFKKGTDFKESLSDKVNDFVDDLSEQFEKVKSSRMNSDNHHKKHAVS